MAMLAAASAAAAAVFTDNRTSDASVADAVVRGLRPSAPVAEGDSVTRAKPAMTMPLLSWRPLFLVASRVMRMAVGTRPWSSLATSESEKASKDAPPDNVRVSRAMTASCANGVSRHWVTCCQGILAPSLAAYCATKDWRAMISMCAMAPRGGGVDSSSVTVKERGPLGRLMALFFRSPLR